MTEEKLMRLIDNAEQYFHRKGFGVDDTRWSVEEAKFAFEFFDEDSLYSKSGSEVFTFFFKYDEDDWKERTAEKQLRDALAETYNNWRS